MRNGESETEFTLINDNKKNPSVVGLVTLLFSDEDGNDRGATHESQIKHTRNINAETNLLFELKSSLNTEKVGDKFDCNDGTNNECQLQNFLAKTYIGGGFEKQKYSESKNVETRVAVVGGLVERNAHKFNRFFDSAKHQSIYHDFLNANAGEGSARDYENQVRKNRYDLGGYLDLSAEATRNLILKGGKCMLSLSAGGAVLIETNGAKRMDVWMSVGLTYNGKKANHTGAFLVGQGVHNRKHKDRLVEDETFVLIRDFDSPFLDNIWGGEPTYSSVRDGYETGLDCKVGFNYTYDRGFFRIDSGVTTRCGEMDMSRDYQDKHGKGRKVDPEFHTTLTLSPGRKNESAMGQQLSEAVKNELSYRDKPRVFQYSFSNESSGASADELHMFELPITEN